MKKHIFIILLIGLVVIPACVSTKEASESRDSKEAIKQAEIQRALESGNYFISVNRLFARRFHGLDLVPDNNYISIENGTARINLAYVGRSFSTRQISGINVRGKIEDITITPKRNGSSLTSMIVVGGGERFKLQIRVSSSGYCNININNGRLDNISYSGKISKRS